MRGDGEELPTIGILDAVVPDRPPENLPVLSNHPSRLFPVPLPQEHQAPTR